MPTSLPNVSSDQPLTRDNALEMDTLQRSGFASAAVAALRRVSSNHGFVLSIEGEWGSGKTSTLAMIERLLTKEGNPSPVVVHFNPWLIGNRDQLLQMFLGTISNRMNLPDVAGDFKKASRQLTNYAKAFDVIRFVPGAEPFASIIKNVLVATGNAASGVAEQKHLDIEDQKNLLVTELRKLARPILVFIDDVDRLYPTEVYEMIRIVKAVGDLPNVGYVVAWDSAYVSKALEAANVPAASTYLDKIVQVRLPLPALRPSARATLLNQAILTLPNEALAAHFPKQDERLTSIYYHGLGSLLHHPRDIARLINTTSVIEPALRGEIVLADIIALASIIVFVPAAHEEMKRDLNFFLGKSERMELNKEKARNENREKLARIVSSSRAPAAAERLLTNLFPDMAKSAGISAFGSAIEAQGHIASPGRLNIALNVGVGQTDVSLVDAKRYVASPESRSAVEQKLSSENAADFLEMIGELSGSIPLGDLQSTASLCLSLSRLVDAGIFSNKAETRGFFRPEPVMLAIGAIQKIIPAEDASKRSAIARMIASDRDALSVAAEILRTGPNSKEKLSCTNTGYNLARKRFGEHVIAASASGQLWNAANPTRLLWTIMRVAPEYARRIYRNAKSQDPTLDIFASHFFRHSFSSDSGQSYKLPDDPAVTKFASIADLKKHARSRLTDPKLQFPTRAAWKSLLEGKALLGRDGTPLDD